MENQRSRWQHVRLPRARLRWFRYRIPFRSPFATAHGQLDAREGVLVALETADGRIGWGEIAPLPGFCGSVDEALACLGAAGERLVGERPSLLTSPPILGERNGGGSTAAWPGEGERCEMGDDSAVPHHHKSGGPAGSAAAGGSAAPRSTSGSPSANPPRPRRDYPVAVPLPQNWVFAPRARAFGALRSAEGQERGPSPSLSTFLNALLPDSATPGAAAVRCGLETALLDVIGQAEGRSIAGLLVEEPATAIPVNATVGAAETARAVEQAAVAAAAGFGAVKLKIGMLPDVAAEAARVAAVRAALGPMVRLRLDANGGWSVAEAVKVLHACEPFDIDYVEQPVAADDLDGLAAVRRQAGVPIAADEALTGVDAVARLLALEAVDVLVLKPMALGGALVTWDLVERARERGVDVVVTSMLDAGVGIAPAAQLAAALPPPLRPCGLATAGLLEHDLLAAPLLIEGGMLRLPTAPGLGVSVDLAALRRYTVTAGGWDRRP